MNKHKSQPWDPGGQCQLLPGDLKVTFTFYFVKNAKLFSPGQSLCTPRPKSDSIGGWWGSSKRRRWQVPTTFATWPRRWDHKGWPPKSSPDMRMKSHWWDQNTITKLKSRLTDGLDLHALLGLHALLSWLALLDLHYLHYSCYTMGSFRRYSICCGLFCWSRSIDSICLPIHPTASDQYHTTSSFHCHPLVTAPLIPSSLLLYHQSIH